MYRARAPLALVAAIIWVAAGVSTAVGVTAAPAHAAAGRCPQGEGVTVVVDYGPLGGGVHLACDPAGAGESARTVMERTGFDLDWVRTEPGFVCAIDSRPDPDRSCQRTPPAEAYWGLFWSDGTSSWRYSTLGAAGLDVPDGGSIGWRFQDGGSRDNPGAAPTSSTPSATPTPSPQPSPTRQPDPPGGSGGGSGGGAGGGSGGGGGDGGSGGPSPGPTPDEPSPTQGTPTPPADQGDEADGPTSEGSGETGDSVGAGGTQGGDKAGKRPDKQPDKQADKQADKQPDKQQGPRQRDDDRPASSEQGRTGRSTVASADVLENQATRPGIGDGVLTAMAMTSVVLLGAAAGVVGWRRRS